MSFDVVRWIVALFTAISALPTPPHLHPLGMLPSAPPPPISCGVVIQYCREFQGTKALARRADVFYP